MLYANIAFLSAPPFPSINRIHECFQRELKGVGSEALQVRRHSGRGLCPVGAPRCDGGQVATAPPHADAQTPPRIIPGAIRKQAEGPERAGLVNTCMSRAQTEISCVAGGGGKPMSPRRIGDRVLPMFLKTAARPERVDTREVNTRLLKKESRRI